MAALVELRRVNKHFGTATEVLRDIDLCVQPHDTVAVLGPSGSGKSTLLNIIGGLLPPSSGEVLFDGEPLANRNAKQLAALRNREIGFIFQAHHLLPQLTALENVLVPTLVYAKDEHRRTAADRASALLQEVGLGERLHHRPAHLSGGEQQRVAVIRALINQPRIVLADEPTGSLDERGTDSLGDLLCQLNERHSVALVTVTHSRRLAARMQRTLELREGSIATAAQDA
ncbi:MAG: lipoprotein-releasing system ATP-binding protein [Planctomycetota bacterium]|jgi:lipoprotein-releasing system ATP-binding protein